MDADRERQRREEAAREEAEKKKKQQEEFERKRSEAASSLKTPGISAALKGADPSIGGNTPLFGLKGTTPEESRAEIRPLNEGAGRSVAKAWEQLHCAASILGHGYAANSRGDHIEFKYLAEEALKALSGDVIRVQCPSNIPRMPKLSGNGVDIDRALGAQRQLIERSLELSDRIERARVERASMDSSRSGDQVERVREEQRRINRQQHEDQASIREQQRRINESNDRRHAQDRARQREVNQRQEEDARKELERLAKINKDLEDATPSSLGATVGWNEGPRRRPLQK